MFNLCCIFYLVPVNMALKTPCACFKSRLKVYNFICIYMYMVYFAGPVTHKLYTISPHYYICSRRHNFTIFSVQSCHCVSILCLKCSHKFLIGSCYLILQCYKRQKRNKQLLKLQDSIQHKITKLATIN